MEIHFYVVSFFENRYKICTSFCIRLLKLYLTLVGKSRNLEFSLKLNYLIFENYDSNVHSVIGKFRNILHN